MNALCEKVKSSAMIQSCLITGLCLVIYWLGPISTWETNDDLYYNLLFSGQLITSEPEPHAFMVNFVLSSIFVKLYTLAPQVPWYGYFHVSSLLLSIWFLNYCYALTRKNDKYLLRIILSLVSVLPLLFLLQFTKTAAVLAVSGYLGLYLLNQVTLPTQRQTLLLYVCAASLLVFSFELRRDSFYLMTLLCGLLMASALLQRRRALLVTLATAAILIVSLGLVHKFNYGEEWQDFYTLGQVIGPIIDYKQYSFEANQKVYADVGFSRNDYAFIEKYGYVDSRVYSPERFKQILNNATSVAPPRDILAGLQKAVEFPAKNFIITAVGLIFLMIICHRQKYRLLALYGFLPTLACTVILAWQGRFPARVSIAIVFFLLWAVLVLCGETRNRLLAGVALAVMLISLAYPLYGQYQNLLAIANARQVQNQDLHRLGASVSALSITLVVFGGSLPYEGLLPFESPSYLKNAHIIWLCGMNQTPVQKKQLEDLKIDDLFVSLMSGTTTYVVLGVEPAELMKKYVYEHYEKIINFTPVYRGNSFAVFRVMASSP